MSVVEESERSGPLGDSGLCVADNLILGHEEEEDIGGIGYINHSCDPNAGFHGQISLVAMRDIAQGDEITIAYAMCIGNVPPTVPDPPVYRLECACGSSDCRGLITDRDWMRPELQARYRGNFQPYLQARIDGRKLEFPAG